VSAVVAAPCLRVSEQGVRNPLAWIAPLHERLFERSTGAHTLAIHDTPPLHYPKTLVRAPAASKRPDVLFFTVESLRSDVMTAEHMPNVTRFAAEHACLRSTHHHSGSHVTQLGLFSLLYGLDSYYFDAFSNEHLPSYPLSVLSRNGYVVSGGCSAHISDWGGASLMTNQFSPYREFDAAGTFERDEQLVRWGGDSFATRDAGRPLFLFLFFDSTHYNYSYPPEFEKYVPALPEGANHFLEDHENPEIRKQVRNRYWNSVAYVDALFGKMMPALEDDWRAGNLVVVLTGDHGEDLWDDGWWGHLYPRFVNGLTEVPLLFCAPGAADDKVELSGHVDVMPTLLDSMGLTPAVDPRAYSNGVSLLKPQDPDRQLIVSSLGLAQWRHDLDLVTTRDKFWLSQGFAKPGDAHSYQLVRASDVDDHERDAAQPEIKAELDRRLITLESEFGSFYRP
jgi:hypothetical protein